MSSIDTLIELIPPPPTVAGSLVRLDWASVERELGGPLPNDYRDFIDRYGFVRLDDFLMIYSPSAPRGPGNLVDQVEVDRESYRAAVEGRLEEPDLVADDLLPFGRTDNGDLLFWLTDGDPDEWPIIVMGEGDRHHDRIERGFAGLLTGLITGELEIASLPSAFPRPGPDFVPVE